jgi:DNA repair photolyase
MKVREINCRSVLTPSRLPSVKYCINPYVGCSHACVYCYAQFMRRFTGHAGERWGSFLDVKVNAPEVLAKELARKPERGEALIGSVTDAYQAMEKKYGLTRRILEVLAEHDWPVSILTKSDLVTRDIDVLRRFSQAEVGLTVTTLDPTVSRDFEPSASLPARRLAALAQLHDAGIRTYAFVGPMLPGLTGAGAIVRELRGKADSVMFETLNLGVGTRDAIVALVSRKYPHLLDRYTPEAIEAAWGDGEKSILDECVRSGITVAGVFRHGRGPKGGRT